MQSLSSTSPATLTTAVTTDTASTAPAARDPACPVSWNALGASIATGLGTVYLINRLAPPPSLTQSVMRYAVGLVPAVIYLATTPGLRPDSPADSTSQQITQIMPFSFESTQERQRQTELRMTRRSSDQLAAIYLTAWLQTRTSAISCEAKGESTLFTQHIAPLAQATKNLHSLVALVTQAGKNGWYTQPLTGSHSCHTHHCRSHTTFGTPPKAQGSAFNWVPARASRNTEPPVAPDQLDVGDVLVLTGIGTAASEKDRIMIAVQRTAQQRFIVLNPRSGVFSSTSSADLHKLLCKLVTESNRTRASVGMIQLKHVSQTS
ncbi:MAG: hypothetical protein OXC07_00340 [Kistimonas sp.]|nr:hypothetical protein [Kistimonas sp.]